LATPDRQLLTVPQVASAFQVTAQTIRNWIDHGTLPAVRVGRAFRVRREDVDALLDTEFAPRGRSNAARKRPKRYPETVPSPALGEQRTLFG
jgi:excisionase family DNA binding protein